MSKIIIVSQQNPKSNTRRDVPVMAFSSKEKFAAYYAPFEGPASYAIVTEIEIDAPVSIRPTGFPYFVQWIPDTDEVHVVRQHVVAEEGLINDDIWCAWGETAAAALSRATKLRAGATNPR